MANKPQKEKSNKESINKDFLPEMNAKNILAFGDRRKAYETILEDFRGEDN